MDKIKENITTPLSLKDYIEVTKPRIVIVLVITALTSALAATRFDVSPLSPWDISTLKLLSLGIAGAMASMGSSALNHYYDRDIDSKMTRTANRPIPTGKLQPQYVMIYGASLCAFSLIFSFFMLNIVTTGTIALGIFFYFVIYTIWLKRINVYNIVIGGFAGSAASMAGWSATTGSI